MTSGAAENATVELAVLYGSRDRISSPPRSPAQDSS